MRSLGTNGIIMSQPTATADGSNFRGILAAMLLLISIPFVIMIVTMPMMGVWGVGHMHGWMWDGAGAPWVWIAMWLVMLGILLGGGYLLYRVFRPPHQSTDAALEELRTSYARGELSDEEFEKRRQRLQQP